MKVGVGVKVSVGAGVLVGAEVSVGADVGVWVHVGVAVMVGVGVTVGVHVAITVESDVARTGSGVEDGASCVSAGTTRMGVFVAVGVAVGIMPIRTGRRRIRACTSGLWTSSATLGQMNSNKALRIRSLRRQFTVGGLTGATDSHVSQAAGSASASISTSAWAEASGARISASAGPTTRGHSRQFPPRQKASWSSG